MNLKPDDRMRRRPTGPGRTQLTIRFAGAVFLVALTMLVAAFAQATAPGSLDPKFGAGGKLQTDFGRLDSVEDLAVQRDGKIVAVGTTVDPATHEARFALARYRRSGSLDLSFGTGGKVLSDISNAASAYAVALQGDGKVVVAGGAYSGTPTSTDIALARYNPDGRLDASFGEGGKVFTDFDATIEGAAALAIQPDGKLVVVGSTRHVGPFGDNPAAFALVRYNADGSLDTTFGAGGKVSTRFDPAFWSLGYGVAIAPDGKIVAAGWALPGGASGPGKIHIARYNADGSLDPTFDGDGRVVSAPGTDNGAFGVVVQPDGKVVVAGFVGFDFVLVRYTAGGSLDIRFGSGGVATAPYRFGVAYDLARQSDGKLVAVGTETHSARDGNLQFAVARFSRSGVLDRSFHDGTVSTELGGLDEANAVALQGTKIVAGGFTAQTDSNQNITAQDFALARYIGAAPPCKVPNVRRKTLGAARAAIVRQHCRVGKVRRTASTTVKRGRIIAQRPGPGRSLPNGSRVDLVVSRGLSRR
jgi:uncharacterized delta-60 repeat protein